MTPAAAWMDRLSDRVGSLIPGGYRLPPRHPVKVSLVMVLLGILAGWVESIPFAMAAYTNQRQILDAVWLVRPVASAVFVVLPVAIWTGQSWWRAVLSTLVSIVLLGILSFLGENIGIAKVRSFPSINAPESTVILFYAIAACVGLLITIVAIDAPRSRWLVLLAAISVPGSLFITEQMGRFTLTPMLTHLLYVRNIRLQTLALSCLTLQIALAPLSLAFCLGVALWDTAPRPKFEPIELERMAGSDA